MARMIPSVMQFRQSPGEVRVYQALSVSLPDEYAVLHHVTWMQKRPGRRSPDGETDFIVTHPERGALAVEVKGGEMRFEAETGHWYSRSRSGEEYRLDKDPFDQARDATYSLIAYLNDLPDWPRRWGPIGYAVCFPDSQFDSRPLPHTSPHIVIDGRDVGSPTGLKVRVEEIFDWWSNEQSIPDRVGFSRLMDVLAHDIEIRRPLGLVADEADREIIRLSEEQYRLLDALGANRRVAVSGPAGSGKTLIALEKAKRLAREGLRVLLTCFNRPLAEFLARQPGVAEEPGLDVFTYHQLCGKLAREAGVPTSGNVDDPRTYERLPEMLLAAIDRLGPRYDSVVADEGQDFEDTWWMTLEMLLTDPDSGIFYIFFDDNQAIYRRPTGLPEYMVKFRLSENWRNTKQIHATVMPFYEGDPVASLGPEGIAIETLDVRRNDLGRELSRVLHRLVKEEGFDLADLVVLTPRNPGRTSVRGRVGAFTLTEHPNGANDIKLSSIHRFKGLESKAVVICDVDRYQPEDFRKLMYVACSRARSHLVILVTEEDDDRPSESFAHAPGTVDTELTPRSEVALQDWIGTLLRQDKRAYAQAILAALREGRSLPQSWPGLTGEEATRLRGRALRKLRPE